MATTSSPDSDVSSTTVQVTTTLGGQQIFQSGGQQYLIVNKALQGSGGRIQIVDQPETGARDNNVGLDAVRRRENYLRQPSYCKILNDLKEVESSESEDQDLSPDKQTQVVKQESPVAVRQETLAIKSSDLEVSDEAASAQTVLINGTAFQIVSGVNLVSGNVNVNSSSAQATSTPAQQFSVNSGASSNGSSSVYISGGTSPQVVTVQGVGTNGNQAEEQARKREIRLMKNREAARECRNKKKEYIKCLENRVAVLENQNKALIEELKGLKELYTGQKN